MRTPSDPSRARAIMVLGTSSHAGKTTVAAAMCRSLHRRGIRVAPFKAQNMSNNSWVTPEGAEIGRAQALQARAAGIEPHADMNPLLLKPSGGDRMQVVASGQSIGILTGAEYYHRIEAMRSLAHAAYDRLADRFDVIVLEGAGSPAEINLRDRDLVNMRMAEHAGARCILVADIERGGVFAAIHGTLSLLDPRHRALVSGVLINKFRGDPGLLDSGIREIETLTGVPILGVLPYLTELGLDEEDSLGIHDSHPEGPVRIDIAVIRFPHLSNFTDFQPFERHRHQGVRVRYVAHPLELGAPDFLILPGSKNTVSDLGFLRRSGLDRVIVAAASRGVPVFGICGGYQILGNRIQDPFGVESGIGTAPGTSPSPSPSPTPKTETGAEIGLGLLPLETVLEREKVLARVKARNLRLPFLPAGLAFDGYEIHMGKTTAIGSDRPALGIVERNGVACSGADGSVSESGGVSGCYLHGLFESPEVRASLFAWLSDRKGLDWPPGQMSTPGQAGLSGTDGSGSEGTDESELDRIAEWLESKLDPLSLL